MGKTIEVLAKGKVTQNTIFNERFVVECCETFHFHIRNLRYEFQHDDFLRLLEAFKEIEANYEKHGRPKSHHHLELGRAQLNPRNSSEEISVELCENLYKKYPTGWDSYFHNEETFVHLHWRDLRVEMSNAEFLEFGKQVTQAYTKLRAKKYKTLAEIFDLLNEEKIVYAVIRNWENLPDNVVVGSHSDLDLLVHPDHVAKLDALLNTEKTTREWYRVQRRVELLDNDGSKSFLFLDVRQPGDQYFPDKLAFRMLARRLRFKNFFVLHPEDYLIGLAYHILIHKGFVGAGYIEKIQWLTSHLPDYTFRLFQENDSTPFLKQVLEKNRVHSVRPIDRSVQSVLPLLFPYQDIVSNRHLTDFNGVPIFSRVYKTSFNGRPVIVKQTSGSFGLHEFTILNQLKGDFFPRVWDFKQEENSCYFFESYCEGRTLAEEADQLSRWSFDETKKFVKDLVAIGEKLEQAGVVHRDFRSDNILVPNKRAVLIDFGWATSQEHPLEEPPGQSLGREARVPTGLAYDPYSIGATIQAVFVPFFREFQPLAEYLLQTNWKNPVDWPHVWNLLSTIQEEKEQSPEERFLFLCETGRYAKAEALLSAVSSSRREETTFWRAYLKLSQGKAKSRKWNVPKFVATNSRTLTRLVEEILLLPESEASAALLQALLSEMAARKIPLPEPAADYFPAFLKRIGKEALQEICSAINLTGEWQLWFSQWLEENGTPEEKKRFLEENPFDTLPVSVQDLTLGWLWEMGEKEEALRVAREKVQTDPYYRMGYKILAEDAATRGALQEALRNYRNYLILVPEDDTAREQMIHVEWELEQGNGKREPHLLMHIKSDNPRELIQNIRQHVQMGEPEMALAYAKKLVQVLPNDPQARKTFRDIQQMLLTNRPRKKRLSLVIPELKESTYSENIPVALGQLEQILGTDYARSEVVLQKYRALKAFEEKKNQKIEISIIIPVFNQLKYTQRCLDGIFQNTKAKNWEVIVVDDASSDGTAEFLAAQNRVTVVRNETNQGFARSCNIGARRARGEILVFLNNDTFPLTNWLEALVQSLQNPEIGAVGAKLLYPQTHRIQHAGKVFHKNERGEIEPTHIYAGEDETRPYVNKLREFQTVTAAVLAVRKTDFEKVDGFDESYRNGWEDDDLCFKIRFQLKKKVLYNPKSVLYHSELITRRTEIGQNEAENRKRFFAKWGDKVRIDQTQYFEEDGFKIQKRENGMEIRHWEGYKLTHEKKKILIVLLVHAGDVLLSTAIVRKIRKLNPNAELTFATAPANVNLLETNPDINHVLPYGSNKYSLPDYEAIRAVAQSFDQVFYLQIWPNRGQEFSAYFSKGEHLVDIYAKNAGLTVDSPESTLIFTDADRQVVDETLKPYFPTEASDFIVLHVRSRDPKKDWPVNHFFQLVTRIRKAFPEKKVVLIGGDESAQYQWDGVINLAGTLTFRQSAELLRRSTLFIGVDSVAAHLAAVSKIKSVVLFVDTPPSLSVPVNPYAVAINGHRSEKPISVEKVWQAVVSQLERKPNSLTSIVVVTYNSAGTLPGLIASIEKNTVEPYEIIVVDNASSDGTQKWLRKQKNVRAIFNKENRGFSAATNQGIKQAKGDFVVFMNPDAVVSPNWDVLLKNHFEESTGAVGPISNFVAGPQNLSQHIPADWQGNFTFEKLSWLVSNRNRGKSLKTKLLIGFCVMLRREAIEKVGMLDEDLFLGNDDLDYSLRLREAGYTLKIATDTFVYHEGQHSFKTLPAPEKERLMQESLDKFYAKLERKFGEGQVPSSTELWGMDILGTPTKLKKQSKVPPLLLAQESLKQFKNKRVALIYDNRVRPDTTGEYCKRALQSICNVRHFLPDELKKLEEGHFDLYLYVDDGLEYPIPFQFRPNAWWVIDTHLQYEKDLKKARLFDVVFAAQRDGAEKLKRDGIRRVFWLPLAADPHTHKKLNRPKKYDVAFVGHFAPGPRNDLLRAIQDNFESVFVGQKFFKEMAEVYSESRIVFNRSLRNDVNMRVFEAVATGSLLVTNDLAQNGQNELFKPGEHLVVYRDQADLIKKIRYYLNHAQEREAIAKKGRAHALAQHTYKQRMAALLEKAFQPEKEPLTVPQKKTSIVILTFNGLDHTKKCVESIRKHTRAPYELIVVDNGSTDGTREYLQTLENVKVILNDKNRGFAAGNNQGIRAATGDYVLLLNNDTVVTQDWLCQLVRAAELAPQVGMVGPRSNYVQNPFQQVENVPYQNMDEMQVFAQKWAAKNRNRYFLTTKLVGFCLLIKRPVIEKVGLLDESFGLGNFEDDDYGIRVRKAGYFLVVAGNVFIHHTGNQAFKENGISYEKMMWTNLEKFKSKWKEDVEFRDERYYLKEDLHFFAEEELAAGEKAFATQNLTGARLHFEKALEWEPENARAWNDMGVVFWQENNPVAASEYFQRAVQIEPGYTDAWSNLLNVAREDGALEKIAQWTEQVAIHSQNAQWLYLLGKQLVEVQNLEIAEKLFRRLKENLSDWPEAEIGLALVAWERGEYNAALDKMDAISRRAPENRELVLNYALMAFQIGERQEATALLRNFIQRHPDKELQKTLDILEETEKRMQEDNLKPVEA